MRKKQINLIILCCILCFQSVLAAHANYPMSEQSEKTQVTEENGDIVCKDLQTNEILYYKLGSENKGSDSIRISEPYIPLHAAAPSLLEKPISPTSIIGDDDRIRVDDTEVFPYSAIAYLSITWPNGSTNRGTAWMLSETAAVTAGHCLYDPENDWYATNVTLYPGKAGNDESSNPYGQVSSSGTKLHVSQNYVKYGSLDEDWGVIELEGNIGKQTGYLGLYCTAGDVTGMEVTITGYPKFYKGQIVYHQYKMTGKIDLYSDEKLYYAIDTSGGQSGAPIYTYNYYAIGIHAYEGNSGTRITPELYDYFMTFRPTIQFPTERTLYFSGEQIELKIYGAKNRKAWVGLYPENVVNYADHSTGMWCYIGSGTQVLPDCVSPSLTKVHLYAATKDVHTGRTYALSPGKYKFVLFEDGGYKEVASQSFEVGRSSITVKTVEEGHIEIQCMGVTRSDAWIGIYELGANYGSNNESLLWKWAKPSSELLVLDFDPQLLEKGLSYDVYLFADGGYTEVAHSILRY